MNSIQFGDGETYFSVASYLDQSLFSLENELHSPEVLRLCLSSCIVTPGLTLVMVGQRVQAGAVPWWVVHQLGSGRAHQCRSHVPLGPDSSKFKPGLMERKWCEQSSCQPENYSLGGYSYTEGRNCQLLSHCLFFDLGKIFAVCILSAVM